MGKEDLKKKNIFIYLANDPYHTNSFSDFGFELKTQILGSIITQQRDMTPPELIKDSYTYANISPHQLIDTPNDNKGAWIYLKFKEPKKLNGFGI